MMCCDTYVQHWMGIIIQLSITYYFWKKKKLKNNEFGNLACFHIKTGGFELQ